MIELEDGKPWKRHALSACTGDVFAGVWHTACSEVVMYQGKAYVVTCKQPDQGDLKGDWVLDKLNPDTGPLATTLFSGNIVKVKPEETTKVGFFEKFTL
ncbi:MAG: hypothetical protein MRY79_01735 [Alphaproteobacteria bacterium]|nr:hypothetical protein [Alphaproteobacteria bacterium]